MEPSEAALKARLRRLCERKANGRLNVPDFVHEQWKSRDHLSMARDFQQCGFDKDRFFNGSGLNKCIGFPCAF